MIRFDSSIQGVKAEHLQGFFHGWPNPPTPETHLLILENSDHVVLAFDEGRRMCVGFITAITDGLLCGYIPLLEVLPEYRGRGIGRELVRRMLLRLKALYMVDLVCDKELLPFYTALGMEPATGAVLRNYANQSASGHV